MPVDVYLLQNIPSVMELIPSKVGHFSFLRELKNALAPDGRPKFFGDFWDQEIHGSFYKEADTIL